MPVVVVGHPIDRLFVDVREHLVRDRCQTRFRVTHVRGRIIVDRVVGEYARGEREVLRQVHGEVVDVDSTSRLDLRDPLRQARRDRERTGTVEPLRDRAPREGHQLILRL